MFDAETNIDIDWRAPIQSLSLSRLESLGDVAMGIGLLCLNSWGRGMTDIAEPGDLRLVIRDEAWKQMRLGVGAVKSLDADLRFSRRDGCIQAVLAHKPSDMLSVGDAGSQAVAIAKDMIGLIDTKVLLGQDPDVGDELGELLNLAPMARDTITGWAMGAKGRALWVVGDRRFKVAVDPHHTPRKPSPRQTKTSPAAPPPGSRHESQHHRRGSAVAASSGGGSAVSVSRRSPPP